MKGVAKSMQAGLPLGLALCWLEVGCAPGRKTHQGLLLAWSKRPGHAILNHHIPSYVVVQKAQALIVDEPLVNVSVLRGRACWAVCGVWEGCRECQNPLGIGGCKGRCRDHHTFLPDFAPIFP